LSIFVAYILSTLLQGVITRPILSLASIAQSVAEKKDYSLRAEINQHDEVGQLSNAFNGMLVQIQQQHEALRESRQRLEVALLGTTDGLWDWDLRSNEVYFSPRWKTMLGYAEEELSNAPQTWERLIHAQDREPAMAMLRDCVEGRQMAFQAEFRMLRKDGGWAWIFSRGAALRDPSGRPLRMAGSHTDITPRKQAEEELAQLNQRLREASRQAGMAEVATGILHNVGNVLNSVNVSTDLLQDRLARSRVDSLRKTVELLKPHAANPGPFFTTDPKGKLVPEFLIKFSEYLANERQEMQHEVAALAKNVDHIKQIVAMQQSYATVSGVIESIPASEVVEDAIRFNEAALQRQGIQVVRRFAQVPPVIVDRHQVLQILINIIRNGNYALEHGPNPAHKLLNVTIASSNNGTVEIRIADNGLGIAPENLTRIFAHGFTTKKDGHGFGLHASANAASAMGGKLTANSEGLGRGATFILELPINDARPNAQTGQTRMANSGPRPDVAPTSLVCP
jgi:PAS domain S-box-containing protein